MEITIACTCPDKKEQWKVTAKYRGEITTTGANFLHNSVYNQCFNKYEKKAERCDDSMSWMCKGREEAVHVSMVISRILCAMIRETRRLQSLAENEELLIERINEWVNFGTKRKELEDRIKNLAEEESPGKFNKMELEILAGDWSHVTGIYKGDRKTQALYINGVGQNTEGGKEDE